MIVFLPPLILLHKVALVTFSILPTCVCVEGGEAQSLELEVVGSIPALERHPVPYSLGRCQYNVNA